MFVSSSRTPTGVDPGGAASADDWTARTGRALTASELAQEAGITPQTASSHLAKLEAGGLIEPEKQGRHRYYRLTDDDVAGVLEGLAGLAARTGHMRVRTGPKDPALRRALGQWHFGRAMRAVLCRAADHDDSRIGNSGFATLVDRGE